MEAKKETKIVQVEDHLYQYIGAKPFDFNGFTVKNGFFFVADEDSDKVLAITSGWNNDGAVYVYRRSPDGEWTGEWEGDETFPAATVINAVNRPGVIQCDDQYDDGTSYFVNDGEGQPVGRGKTPLEAAADAASWAFKPGSAFWHVRIAQILEKTGDVDLDVLNG